MSGEVVAAERNRSFANRRGGNRVNLFLAPQTNSSFDIFGGQPAFNSLDAKKDEDINVPTFIRRQAD